ncbi:MAG: VWA domain-containing protein [Myxococcales bacterium]|nr:VWA domain-containing protein [Myxococcales bacterium]
MRRALIPGMLLLAACPKERLKPARPPDVWVDTYDQQAASKVDVLWVVDNSGSMAPRQENLAKNFQSFIELFSKGSIDFRIAITTTDVFKDQGQFKGTPRILSSTTPNLANAFSANIKVGITGSPYEAGLQAAQMALERQAQTNAPKLAAIEQCKTDCQKQSNPLTCSEACPAKTPIDFLRPDAYLYLIFVSDEEDRSSQDIRYYWRAFETAKGIGNDGTVTTAAIIGDVPTNSCGATPGARYVGLSSLTGGEVGSVCDVSFATTLRKLATNAVGLKRKFALSRSPNVQTIKVLIRYPCNSAEDVFKGCAEVNKEDCKDAPADSLNAVCTPRQGGPDGWSYEPSTQVIFFAGESVPGLRASVEIEYYEEGTGP